MFRECLFLGFPIDLHLEQKLAAIDPQIHMLVLSGGDYLHEFEDHGNKYLGKIIPDIMDPTSLELLKSNIASLKHYVFPDLKQEETEFWLFAIVQSD